MKMISLIDTNILIYSLISNSPKHKKSIQFLEELINKKEHVAVAQQNILETHRALAVVYGVSHKTSLKKTLDLVTFLGAKIIYPQANTIHIYSKLLPKNKVKFDHFDNYLAATMTTNNIKTIYTANEKDFLQIKNIKVINPTL